MLGYLPVTDNSEDSQMREFFWGIRSLRPGTISGKDKLKVIGQLSGALQKVLGALRCGNTQ